MQTDNLLNSDGDLIEERFTTHVRGTKFTISPSVINTILKMNPFPVAKFSFTNEEIWSILKPELPFPEDQSQLLSFTPTSMSTKNRILWYIFSRNFIQKGGDFTHFAQRDYPIFAALVNQAPFDLGHHIFHEMLRFKFPTRKLSHMPFPSFISVILFYFKIWYVGTEMKYPPLFGKAQLNLMNIVLEGEESGQSRAPTRSQTRAPRTQSKAPRAQSQSQNQEAQSAPPPPSVPTDFETRVKEIVDAANAACALRIEKEIQQLRAEYSSGSKGLAEVQDAMKDEMFDITGQLTKLHEVAEDHDIRLSNLTVSSSTMNDKLDKLLKHFNIGSSTFGTTSAPHTTEPASGSSVPQAPIPSPSPTSGPAFTSHTTPATVPATVPYKSIIPSLSPKFDDDKGGEEDQS